ncbi:hypothetical protein OCGS_1982 [Oceaniovalibus guishaninsula JLT2003]|uniref:FAD dependent oxidoreductase domain-containing protein n=1 Tax=Oceaniovalibus guishaninsula JLT2003 TaxID=1231392 RepID=K2GMP8_9RHOB|nr:FAD-binding oxidoreductase [Oceaniovalibus guishaninsula]EKE44001.1 hypothetical protein OCGS_1982 [Oceaniovalibus guishaninsula JLT2003]
MQVDIAIVGGGIMGASIAWHLTRADPALRIAVIERDPSFEHASSTATNSCIRQQFSTAANVLVSRYAAEVIADFPEATDDPAAPRIATDYFGYLYLAGDEGAVAGLRAAQAVQRSCGAATRLMTPEEIMAEYPFFDLTGIVLGSQNPRDEGWFDGHAMWEYWRRAARRAGVVFRTGEVAALRMAGGRIGAAVLADGTSIGCGWLVNAAGPRAAALCAMAGCAIPVEPRKRFTYVFRAATPLPCRLPLTIDPSGVHVRSDGDAYMAGCPPRYDGPVAPDDFEDDPDLWMDKVWPVLAARIPAFEAIRLTRSWVGHYAWNPLDRNAILGPHPGCANLMLCNGFSGHGLQQAPAMGRGAAEWIVSGRFTTLDLSAFTPARLTGAGIAEAAVI